MKKKILVGAGIVCVVSFVTVAWHANRKNVTVQNTQAESEITMEIATEKMQDELEQLQEKKENLEKTDAETAKETTKKEEQLKELTEEIAETEIELGIYDYRSDIEILLNTIHAAAEDNERAATFYDEKTAEKIRLHCKKLYELEEQYQNLLKKANDEDLEQMAVKLEQDLNELNAKYHNY